MKTKACCLFSLFLLSSFLLLPRPLHSQTIIPAGTITSNMTWDLSGSPFVLSCGGVTVAPGVTLTVSPGVVVKFAPPQFNCLASLQVNGALIANGTTLQKILFTSTLEDTGSAAPASWQSISFNIGSSGSVSNAIFRYGGAGYPLGALDVASGSSAVSVTSSTFTDNNNGLRLVNPGTTLILTGSTFSRNSPAGIWIENGAAPTISNSSFDHNTYGVYSTGGAGSVSNNTFDSNINGIRTAAAATGTITNNTFTTVTGNTAISIDANFHGSLNGNTSTGTGLNAAEVQSGTLFGGSVVWGQLTMPYAPACGQVTIAGGATLTIQPGVAVKSQPGQAFCSTPSIQINDGTLTANGTAAQKIFFTSTLEDSGTAGVGSWGGVHFAAGSSGSVSNAIFRYGGAGYPLGALDVASGNSAVSVTSSTFTDNNNGLRLVNPGTTLILTGSTFSRNLAGIWIENGAAPTISNNSFDHNTYGVYSTGGTGSVSTNTFDSNSGAIRTALAASGSFSNNTITTVTGNIAISIDADFRGSLSGNTSTGTGLNAAEVQSGTLFGGSVIWGQLTMPYAPACGQVTVASGATLTIQPGVAVKFQTAGFFCSAPSIQVNGALVANGTAAQKILFTSILEDSGTAGVGSWGGVHFAAGSSGSVSNAIFRYGGAGYPLGALDVASGSSAVAVTSSTFTDNNNGLRLVNPGTTLILTGSTFSRNSPAGIWIENGAAPTISNSSFDHNGSGILYQNGGAGLVSGNTFQANSNGITVSGGSVPHIRLNNILTNSQFGVLNVECGSTSGTCTTTADVDATGNYWGAANGPSGPGGTGSGDPVSFHVNFGSFSANLITPSSGTGNAPPVVAGTGMTGSNLAPRLSVVEPIDTGSGNYLYQHTDFVIPGRGLPLVFQRTYNSLDNYAGPLGANWTHTYNIILGETATGDVIIRWGDGHGETFVLGGSTYTPQPGLFSTLIKNVDSTFLLTQRNQTQYTFSFTGKLNSMQGRNGNAVLLSYDGLGNLAQITDSVGRILTLTYDASNRITQVTDPATRTVSFQYSSSNDLISATDLAGGLTQFAYDANHRVTSILQPTGQILLQNTYDLAGHVVSQTNGRGATTAIAYDIPNVGDRTIIDARGNHTIHTYDGSLRIVRVTDALLGTTSFTYDANNNRTNVTNPNGETTGFTYDPPGNITGISDPRGNTIAFTYDSRNNLLAATNAKGNTTDFEYDSNGNLTRIQDALGQTTTFSYDGLGELTSKTDAKGNTTAFTYDSAGNLIRITDAVSKNTNLSYDAIGRLLSITDPNAHTATAAYDALSRLVKIADPLGNQTRFAYDAVGNLLTITDAKGSVTSYAYDATNNLVSVTDALGRVTQYAYDGNNNRVSFRNARGTVTSYGYDSLNRLTALNDPIGFATTYAYDSAGNVVSTRDANGTTNQLAYDALNRLLGIAYGDGKTVSYTYDPDGNRTSMADSHGVTTYSYDALDRLISVAHPGGRVVAYGYDTTGNRVSLSYPDGKLSTYSYDALNRLATVTDWLARPTNYAYDAASNLTQILYPNNTSIGFAYDAANRLTKAVNSALGLPLLTLGYTLDQVGNRTALSVNGLKTNFAYDALNELLSAQLGPLKSAWTYDTVGNRLKETSPLGTTLYTYDAADRLLSAGSTIFSYDANGNRISKRTTRGTMNYSYDAANRLTAALGLGTNSSFGYDGDGNRIVQGTLGGSYAYVNDVATALPVVLNEQGPDGDIAYAYGLGLIEEASPTFNYFYHYDGLGSTIALTDAAGKPRAAYAYDTWGNPLLNISDSVGTKNKVRFTGEALDPGTGLYYLRARYYDPSVGRFITTDSFFGQTAQPLSLHRFLYTGNNPVNFSDPSGLVTEGLSTPQTSFGVPLTVFSTVTDMRAILRASLTANSLAAAGLGCCNPRKASDADINFLAQELLNRLKERVPVDKALDEVLQSARGFFPADPDLRMRILQKAVELKLAGRRRWF